MEWADEVVLSTKRPSSDVVEMCESHAREEGREQRGQQDGLLVSTTQALDLPEALRLSILPADTVEGCQPRWETGWGQWIEKTNSGGQQW